jgi:hypothetical protein
LLVRCFSYKFPLNHFSPKMVKLQVASDKLSVLQLSL